MNMTTFFIIHGAYGNPQENWIPWLKRALEKEGHTVFVPTFPTPEHQSLKSWLEVFQPYQRKLREDSIVIGHSIAPAFLLTILEKIPKPIKAAFFIAPFITPIGNPAFDTINQTFYRKFKWKQIRQNCTQFYLFHSDNDPYVPLEKAEEVAKYLGVMVIIVKGAGHFNEKAGYTQFELLLKTILKEL